MKTLKRRKQSRLSGRQSVLSLGQISPASSVAAASGPCTRSKSRSKSQTRSYLPPSRSSPSPSSQSAESSDGESEIVFPHDSDGVLAPPSRKRPRDRTPESALSSDEDAPDLRQRPRSSRQHRRRDSTPDSQSSSDEDERSFLIRAGASQIISRISTRARKRMREGKYVSFDTFFDGERQSRSRAAVADVMSFDRWLRASLAMGAFISAIRPAEAPGIFQHISTVRQLYESARHHSGWLLYDQMFRRNLADGFIRQWSEFDPRLFEAAKTEAARTEARGRPFRTTSDRSLQPRADRSRDFRRPRKQPFPCFKFNSSSGCPWGSGRCQFYHQCISCKQFDHNKLQCRQVKTDGPSATNTSRH